ncbi:MAG: hypothetical protein F6K39_35570 [Okeania sp. SIO3B3]|nr:hypothetical protein [Okeania sp. SIO3B3]
MTLKKAKKIIELDLEVANISPEIDPEIPEITRILKEKGYQWLEQIDTLNGSLVAPVFSAANRTPRFVNKTLTIA